MITWSIKITAVLLKLGQTRIIISPMNPKITEKREKRIREREREKKKTSNSLVFIVCTLKIVFERQKTSADGHSQTLTQSDLVFIYIYIYRFIYIYIYIYIYIFIYIQLFANILSTQKYITISINQSVILFESSFHKKYFYVTSTDEISACCHITSDIWGELLSTTSLCFTLQQNGTRAKFSDQQIFCILKTAIYIYYIFGFFFFSIFVSVLTFFATNGNTEIECNLDCIGKNSLEHSLLSMSRKLPLNKSFQMI